jgi:hypothetical protein
MSSDLTKTIAASRAYVAAGRAKWDVLWALGDALIEECGRPGANSANNGSSDRLERASAELRRLGLPHSLVWLRKVRKCAAAFSDDNRLSGEGVPWTVHLAAGDPQNLHEAKKRATRQKAELTVSFVKTFLQRRRAEHERNERKRHPDLNGREQPKPEREKAKEDFVAATTKAQELIDTAERLIKPHVDRLSAAERKQLFVCVRKAAQQASALAHLLEPPSIVELQEAAE